MTAYWALEYTFGGDFNREIGSLARNFDDGGVENPLMVYSSLAAATSACEYYNENYSARVRVVPLITSPGGQSYAQLIHEAAAALVARDNALASAEKSRRSELTHSKNATAWQDRYRTLTLERDQWRIKYEESITKRDGKTRSPA